MKIIKANIENYDEPELHVTGDALVRYVPVQKFEVPDGIKYIGPHAFVHGEYLTELIIPDTVECIEVSAFYGCTNLKKITLPIRLIEKMGDLKRYFKYCDENIKINAEFLLSDGNASPFNKQKVEEPEIIFPEQIAGEPLPKRTLSLDARTIPVMLGRDKDDNDASIDLMKYSSLLIAGSEGKDIKAMLYAIIDSIAKSESAWIMPVGVDITRFNSRSCIMSKFILASDDKTYIDVFDKATKESENEFTNIYNYAKNEMERRFELFKYSGVKNIEDYQKGIEKS